MLLFLGTAFFTLVKVGTAPAKYDQRQEGDFNLHAQLDNLLFVVAIPSNNDLVSDLALQALDLKQHLVSRSSSSKEQASIESDEETRNAKPYTLGIIQVNENQVNKGNLTQDIKGHNNISTTIMNNQAFLSIIKDKEELKEYERSAKNVKAFEFPKSREEPAVVGYLDTKKMLGSKIEDDERVRDVIENVRNPVIKSGKPGMTLKKQLFKKEEDIALPSSNTDKNDVTSLSEDKQQGELILLGDEYRKNCGPDGHRDASGICHYQPASAL